MNEAGIRANPVLGPRDGATSVLLILVISSILFLMGMMALRVTTSDIRSSSNYKKSVTALYIAEAGIARARLALTGRSFDDMLESVGVDTTAYSEYHSRTASLRSSESRDTALDMFIDTTAFGQGSYVVQLLDNNDGDGLPLDDSDGRVMVRCRGILPDGSDKEVEVTFGRLAVPTFDTGGAIVASGNVRTLGTLIVDGHDHDMDGNQLSTTGKKAIKTLGTYSRGGNSKMGGYDEHGLEYAPSRWAATVAQVTEENSSDFAAPSSPDDALGVADGTLEQLAKSGAGGSQYVENPADLTTPLDGVTYVKLPCGGTWNPVHFGDSKGILVVHSDCNDATIKNLNTGSFKGILLADDIVHIHCDIIGMVVQTSTAPSSGNCIGNGHGKVLFSREAILNALTSITDVIRVVAWREL